MARETNLTMARTVQVEFLDDIDGSRADETLRYGLDGMNYEIDVNAQHAEKLRASLAEFITRSRRVGRGRVTATARPSPGGSARSDRAHNQAIREWAKSQGIAVSERGRIPRGVVEQYEAAADR
jgi:nucleoid-associated protein Lsr2